MEADLPMDQLSEMFNVNHFIVSQANPHAIMFSSLSISKSIWQNSFISCANGILLFVKNQVRAWFKNVVTFIGGRRVSPLWDTRRGFFLQFFTQEYEGRDCDITLNPWAGHLSLFKSFIRCIYNPTQEEFETWIEAAESETWRYIPAIKSHIAEEMTLDRCVQKLRKQIIAESYENFNVEGMQDQRSDKDKLGKGHPSFFQSPSLVNLGGLGVTDQHVHQEKVSFVNHHNNEQNEHTNIFRSNNSHQHIEFKSGWGGMGLHGNHQASANSLHKSISAGSGLFFIEDDVSSTDEATGSNDYVPDLPSTDSFKKNSASDLKEAYVKTTNMANFYYNYRRSSQENLHNGGGSEVNDTKK